LGIINPLAVSQFMARVDFHRDWSWVVFAVSAYAALTFITLGILAAMAILERPTQLIAAVCKKNSMKGSAASRR
jgi:hypothetical protein